VRPFETSPGERLIEIEIRPYAEGDAEPLLDAVRESLDTIGKWQSWCHPGYGLVEARTWVLWQAEAFVAGSDHEFVVTAPDGRLLGACGLNAIDLGHRRANLGYWVRASAEGRGVATEAARRVAAWAFAHTALRRLEIVAAVGNRASQRVAEKVGAQREGIARSRLLVHGVPHDAVVYAIVRPQNGGVSA
jgi:RimJ/RimL family protein N-acetyltransferase